MSPHDHRSRLALQLAARGDAELLPLLESAIGQRVGGRYQIEAVLGVGSQAYLFRATDSETGQLVAVRQPAFNYLAPASYDRAAVSRARALLREQARVLKTLPAGVFPAFIGLVQEESVVAAAREWRVFDGGEYYLVQEFLPQPTLTHLALGFWAQLPALTREERTRSLVGWLLQAWIGLQRAGWLYFDINSDNIVGEADAGRFHLLDPGSLVPAVDGVRQVGYTPAFTTPALYARLRAQAPLAARVHTVLPMLGKLAHFVLTTRQPLNGAFPDLNCLESEGYSTACRSAVAAMVHVDRDATVPAGLPPALLDWIPELGAAAPGP